MSVTIGILNYTNQDVLDRFLNHNRDPFDVYPSKDGGEFRIVVDTSHRDERATAAQLMAIVALNYDPPEGLTKHTANILIQQLRGTYRAQGRESREQDGEISVSTCT